MMRKSQVQHESRRANHAAIFGAPPAVEMSEEQCAEIATVFRWLNDIRDGGTRNMWGASPLIEKAYDCSPRAAGRLHSAWMDWCEAGEPSLTA